MSNNDTREITDFLTIVQKGVRKHGIKKIVKIIQAIDLQENNMFYNDILNYILDIVSNEFLITKKDLIGKEKRGDVTIARKIVVILAKEHLDISDELLAEQFNRVRQVVHGIRTEYNSYNRDDKFYAKFFDVYDRLNTQVVKHIEYLKR